jgi:hypothetical protein
MIGYVGMSDLIIELERVTIESDSLSLLRAELESAGMVWGHLAMGDVTADPDLVYFLWHESGEVPVSMLFERRSFADEQGTRTAAQSFLAKWQRRLQ